MTQGSLTISANGRRIAAIYRKRKKESGDSAMPVAESSSGNEFSYEDATHADNREKPSSRISIEDGFVPNLVDFPSMEHEERVRHRVLRDQSAVTLHFIDARQSIASAYREGSHYKVSMGDKINLRVIISRASAHVPDNSIDVISAIRPIWM